MLNSTGSELPPKSRIEQLIERAVAFCASVVTFVLAYLFFDAIAITFGAVLAAVLISLLSTPIGRWLKIRGAVSVTLTALILIAAVAGAGYLFGTRLASDLQEIISRMSAAQENIKASLQSSGIGKALLSQFGGASIPLTKIVTSVFSTLELLSC